MNPRISGGKFWWGDERRPSFEMQRENMLVILFVVVVSTAFGLVLVATYGNIFITTALFGGLLVVMMTLYRVDWGFFVLIGVVLAFDQHEIPWFDPWSLKLGYFQNLKEIPYLPYMDAAVANPMELHLVFLLLVWFIVTCIKRDARLSKIPVWGTAVLFFASLIGSLAFGLRRGGEMLPALWEIRALFYFGLMYIFVPQIIQTREQLKTLLWVCIGAISLKAFEGIVRFIRLGFSFHGIPTLTNHEDPVFMLALIIFLLALVMFGDRSGQRNMLLFLLLPLMLGFFVSQRRAAYAAIPLAFLTLLVLLSGRERWILLRNFLPVLFVIALYSVVLWNSESRFASPVRLIKSGLSLDPEMAGERYYSNLYREYEKYNLAVTAKRAPTIGIGFGNKYDMPLPLANIPFPLRDYIPHNEILWVLVKTGAAGFFLFWFFFNSYGFRAASMCAKLKDPYLKAVIVMAVSAIVSQMVVSYFDLQLTYYRNMVFLGTLMGLLPTLESIDQAEAKNVDTNQTGGE